MKKYLLLAFIIMCLGATAQTAKTGATSLKYKISGKMSGFKQKQIVLERLTLQNATAIDSVPYKKNGEFSFSGSATEPGLYRLRCGISLASTVLIAISEKNNDIVIETDSAGTSKFAYTVKGSKGTLAIRNILAEAVGRYNYLNTLSNSAMQQQDMPAEQKQKVYKQIDSLNAVNRNYINTYIDTVNNKLIAIFSAVSFLNPDTDFAEWEKLEAKLKKENISYSIAKEFIALVEQQRKYAAGSSGQGQFKIGDVLSDIEMKDTTGNVIKLSSLRGKYVLVDFWASWCGPCRAENPTLVRGYKQYRDKGFTIYSVSLDNDKNRWKKAILSDKLEWSYHVSELRGWQSSVCTQFGINSIPTNFLIDREGKIIGIGLRGEELINELNDLLQ